jgi:hypothetical protein
MRCAQSSPASAWKAIFGIRNRIISVSGFIFGFEFDVGRWTLGVETHSLPALTRSYPRH